ncbi:hypothetical protein ID856_17845 [Xenorhabdus sp. 18]|uniref:hypothetical protein n=1 Tax=Xenorhabdus doucetiae TaxID=351671 RepID=UPI00198CDCF5|nr:hypothetical protein [Xenorhabdus sp. 18]MBD2798346.1 hypothetical protein [Xenorhabdus sp. 18]
MLNPNQSTTIQQNIIISSNTGIQFPDKSTAFISGQNLTLNVRISGTADFNDTDKIFITTDDN